jgi:murein DD-endopeptidase MepM/ murein hydrolase activator NlpD
LNKERQAYTIMVVPEREGKEAFSFRISRRRVIFLTICAAVAVISMGVLIFKSVEATRKFSYFYTLNRENEELTKQNARLRLVHEKIGKMDTIAQYLENLADIQGSGISLSNLLEKEAAENESEASDTTADQTGGKGGSIGKDGQAADLSIPAQLPLDGWITQQFALEQSRGKTRHLGIDIAAKEGTAIKAPASGVVESVSNDRYYGILLVIKHTDEYSTRYGHCNKALVSPGERVEMNQHIALVGNTGRSTAPHLHYEVVKNGKNINPMELLPSEKK